MAQNTQATRGSGRPIESIECQRLTPNHEMREIDGASGRQEERKVGKWTWVGELPPCRAVQTRLRFGQRCHGQQMFGTRRQAPLCRHLSATTDISNDILSPHPSPRRKTCVAFGVFLVVLCFWLMPFSISARADATIRSRIDIALDSVSGPRTLWKRPIIFRIYSSGRDIQQSKQKIPIILNVLKELPAYINISSWSSAQNKFGDPPNYYIMFSSNIGEDMSLPSGWIAKMLMENFAVEGKQQALRDQIRSVSSSQSNCARFVRTAYADDFVEILMAAVVMSTDTENTQSSLCFARAFLRNIGVFGVIGENESSIFNIKPFIMNNNSANSHFREFDIMLIRDLYAPRF